MARSMKQGLDYFPLDVDFFEDIKMQFISARFGIKGEIIIIRLLCQIYRQGYYIDWNNDTAMLFAKSVGDGCQHTLVNDVIYESLKRGFFDESIFEKFFVLTSRGIQLRYLDASNRRKRVDILEELLLVDTSIYQNVNINRINVDINGINVDINSQSKVKESKVKESKKHICSKANALNDKTLSLESKEFKNTKKTKEHLANEMFERLWSKYPCKRGKGQVSMSKKLKLLSIGEDQLERCIDRYIGELETKKNMDYIQNGSTFFNSGYIDFLDSEFESMSNNSYVSKSENIDKFASCRGVEL